ncbi:MAG: DUF444 family protein [Desulfobacteraceae bacterium]|jgi:uncharacterized sporulation protein YeaH/YhbH (DUF444 family)
MSDKKDKSQNIQREQGLYDRHYLPDKINGGDAADKPFGKDFRRTFYDYSDLIFLQEKAPLSSNYTTNLSTIDELLERDKQRSEDGFPKKIRLGRFVKPGRGGKNKIVVVPSTVEEKFIHDTRPQSQDQKEGNSGGSGEGEEGEVIGEESAHEAEGGSGTGAGQGEPGEHEIESSAYDLGKILTEKFQLPNLQEKGKKRSLSKYTYDLTDRAQGAGQIIDKKATLKKILETNINLDRVSTEGLIDPTELLVSPGDRVYRILSKEKDYESQAMVFLLRDYSGSMSGGPTEMIVNQHVLIYSWLIYQYDRQVETRFILHDEEAKEVPDFYTYYNSTVAGGTRVASAFRLVNEIVEKENLARDYNIYIFHGTDGDDWDSDGSNTIPEIRKALAYSSRIGITVARMPSYGVYASTIERYMANSKLLTEYPKHIRMDTISENDSEERLINGIKNLIS